MMDARLPCAGTTPLSRNMIPATSSEKTSMLRLTPDTEDLARRVAARCGREPDDLIRAALKREVRALGIDDADEPPVRRRMTADEMRAFGRKVEVRSVLDPRSAREIADDPSGADVERWR